MKKKNADVILERFPMIQLGVASGIGQRLVVENVPNILGVYFYERRVENR